MFSYPTSTYTHKTTILNSKDSHNFPPHALSAETTTGLQPTVSGTSMRPTTKTAVLLLFLSLPFPSFPFPPLSFTSFPRIYPIFPWHTHTPSPVRDVLLLPEEDEQIAQVSESRVGGSCRSGSARHHPPGCCRDASHRRRTGDRRAHFLWRVFCSCLALSCLLMLPKMFGTGTASRLSYSTLMTGTAVAPNTDLTTCRTAHPLTTYVIAGGIEREARPLRDPRRGKNCCTNARRANIKKNKKSPSLCFHAPCHVTAAGHGRRPHCVTLVLQSTTRRTTTRYCKNYVEDVRLSRPQSNTYMLSPEVPSLETRNNPNGTSA